MSKKVLIISASPRKNGNSDTLCNEFARGATESGNIVEKIRVDELDINFCNGCGVCNSTKKCTIKDDAPAIVDKMVDADIIVLATPVYFYTMDAQMKVLIDRTTPRYTDIRDKEFYFIATAADTNDKALERTFDGFRAFLDCLPGAKEMGVIYGSGVWQKGEIDKTEHMSEAYLMGKTIR